MDESLITNLDRLWFDFNYGGLAVSKSELLSWSYTKIRTVVGWFFHQKKIEEAEYKKNR